MKNILVIFLLLGFISSCGKKEQAAQEQAADVHGNLVSLSDVQKKNIGITLCDIENKNLSEVLRVNGTIDVPPQNMVSISVPLGGYLKYTKLLPGMHLNKGEIIAVMEDQQYIQLQQDYLTAKSQLVFLENDFVRQQELSKEQASSEKVFQKASADYESQKVLVKSLSEKLRLLGIDTRKLNSNNLSKSINIKSPIDGYVSVVNVNIGKYVAPTDVLFELVNPEDIHLNLSIYEKDLSKIKLKQELYAYTNDNSQKKYLCEIILIGKKLSASRNVEVHCHFEQYDHTLIPGMYMNAEIETSSHKVAALPEKCVVSFEGKQYIFVAKDAHTFEMQEVKTGVAENGFIAIENADKLRSQKVVLEGAYWLLMKLKNVAEEE